MTLRSLAPPAMAMLATFLPRCRRFFTVVSEIAAGVLPTFLAGLGRFLPIVCKIARVRTFIAGHTSPIIEEARSAHYL